MEYSKNIGTREEVYKLIAKRTNGGLLKCDIIEKNNNGKLLYISKKISDKMKANTSNICFLKKKTQNNNQNQNNHNNQNNQNNQNQNNNNNQNQNNQTNKTHNKNKKKCKTQKLLFEINKNEFKNIYYPELKGQNLQDLKDELRREEEEEDNCDDIEGLESLDELEEVFKPNASQCKKEFKIEELQDIDIDINSIDF